jgi:hypothetical protein
MNDETIFLKTASGEDAVRDRTRLVQRNLRMVLILVDGLTKVSALKQKAGDPAMIETALAELERIGLIESAESRGTRQASIVTEALSIAAVHPVVAAYAVPSVIDEREDFPTAETVFEDVVGHPTATLSAETVIPVEASTSSASPPSSTSEGWFTRMFNRWHQVREERAFEKAYDTPSPQVEAAPKRRRVGRKTRLVPLALIVAIIGGVAGIVLYPYNEHRPEIEAHLSKMLADEVRVGEIKLIYSPVPAISVQKVSVGRTTDATVEQISIIPSFGFIFGGRPLQTVRINGLHIRENAIGKIANWFLPGTMGEYQVDGIEVDNLSLDLGWAQVRGLSGTLRPSLSGVASFVGRAGEGDFEFDVVPENAGLTITARAGQWVVPVDPPLKVAALDFNATLAPGNLVMTKVDVRAFDGLVTGHGTMTWDSSPRMVLDLAMKHVGATKLLEVLRAPVLLSGELSGQVQYSASAPSIHWLGANAKATGQVAVVRGGLRRLDLAGALRTSGQHSGPYRGGETGFEDFAGKFSLDAGSVRISDVRLSSGLMLASGQATVNRATDMISGTANVEMRGSARAPRVTLSISGKASDPELKTAQ